MIKSSLRLFGRFTPFAVLASLVLGLATVAQAAATSSGDAGDYFYRPGYEVLVYQGPWHAKMDLDKRKQISTQAVFAFGKRAQFKCEVPKGGFTVLKGYLQLSKSIKASFHPGYGPSSVAVMTVDGKQVYSMLPGQKEAHQQSIDLSAGFHAFRIIHFTEVNRLTCFSNLGQRLGANYVRTKVRFTAGMETKLVNALDGLTQEAASQNALSRKQIDACNAILENDKYIFGERERIISAALKFAAAFDAHHPYLFKRKHTEWNRHTPRQGIRWADFQVMQYLLDYAYTPANLAKYPDLLGQVKFATANYFPGPCPKPSEPDSTYSVKIWASYPRTPAYDIWVKTWTSTARKATGAYLSPGTVATVTVPESLVNKGYGIRVGAASHDMERKNHIDRLFRVSLVYPIRSTQVKVANPLGGGIYLEVPIGADGGAAELKFKNIVRAPFFADTRVKKTTLAEWLNTERHDKAPWADFQSEAFMMQVPRTWIYKLKDPVTLMANWDRAVTAVLHVMGYTVADIGQVGLYLQPDTQIKASVFSPGYPQTNYGGVTPGNDKFHGLATNYFVQGPRQVPNWTFHEWGHALNLANPNGEMESSNNFLYAVAENLGLGMNLDKAFSQSRGSKDAFRTLDHTAELWMTDLSTFLPGYMHVAQKAYQLEGHAKYVDIARLFGWETLAKFYHQVQLERTAYIQSGGKQGFQWPKNVSSDFYVLHLSESSGIDMRPLFHFWGTPPQAMLTLSTSVAALKGKVEQAAADVTKAKALADSDKSKKKALRGAEQRLKDAQAKLSGYPAALQEAKAYARQFGQMIQAGEIRRSAKIYDELVHYKSLVPADSQAYRKFASQWFDWKTSPPKHHLYWSPNDHRRQWYAYTSASAVKVRSHIDDLIKLYFPNGRPKQ